MKVLLRKKYLFTFLFYISLITCFLNSSSSVYSQCKGVRIDSASLVVVKRPCGPTPTGSLALEIKGGRAPFTISWTVDNMQDSLLPQDIKSNKLIIDSLKGAFKPGYQVRVKDACGNETTSNAIQLVYAVPMRFASAPQVKTQSSDDGLLQNGILVEVIGGFPPRTILATDSKGKTYIQKNEVGPPEKGIVKYELANLPEEKYKIELKSGSEKCTQVWKETIELKAHEK